MDDLGRLASGSSMLMDFFPVEYGTNDFLRSFFVKGCWTGDWLCSWRSSSPERLKRANILDCFLGTVLNSTVGAVVMISGGAFEPASAGPAEGWEEEADA